MEIFQGENTESTLVVLSTNGTALRAYISKLTLGALSWIKHYPVHTLTPKIP